MKFGLYYKNLTDNWTLYKFYTSKVEADKDAKRVAKTMALNGRVTVQVFDNHRRTNR